MNRTKLRENVFKLLFCKEFHSREEMPKQYELFWDGLDGVSDEEREYISTKVTNITEKEKEIDKEINRVSKG